MLGVNILTRLEGPWKVGEYGEYGDFGESGEIGDFGEKWSRLLTKYIFGIY